MRERSHRQYPRAEARRFVRESGAAGLFDADPGVLSPLMTTSSPQRVSNHPLDERVARGFKAIVFLPIIIASGLLETATTVPWWNNRTLRLTA